MLQHSREHYSHCVHVEHSRDGIPWTSSVVWFQIICEPNKYSPYHYGVHNPVFSRSINKDGGKSGLCTVGLCSINVVPCFPFCLEQ